MNSLKKAIFNEIRKVVEDCQDLDDVDLNKLVFHHPDGLRLSLTGFRIIRKIFTAYSFEIPKTIKCRHHFNMANMQYPYYMTTKRLVLFSEMDAMTVKLTGGIERFLENSSEIEI